MGLSESAISKPLFPFDGIFALRFLIAWTEKRESKDDPSTFKTCVFS